MSLTFLLPVGLQKRLRMRGNEFSLYGCSRSKAMDEEKVVLLEEGEMKSMAEEFLQMSNFAE